MKQFSLNKKEEKGLKLRFNLKQVREENKLTQIMLVTTINKKKNQGVHQAPRRAEVLEPRDLPVLPVGAPELAREAQAETCE